MCAARFRFGCRFKSGYQFYFCLPIQEFETNVTFTFVVRAREAMSFPSIVLLSIKHESFSVEPQLISHDHCSNKGQ